MDDEQQDFTSSTETREFPNGRLDLVRTAVGDDPVVVDRWGAARCAT